ncbi:hypothetical protein DJ568_03130 [Mucilaginibacter hurinus]|uniref:Uncharacterized protein n=1 Tax=Mucilaginibacter hurinus TaxID=2201324 RepID=A0A367GW07_9SPHI|nr:hypothetical protein [Mucilaginibacter hurinus]RCH56863.1 hypothetical protein DJ568_03130 [Mucilaginibacter hurinus]
MKPLTKQRTVHKARLLHLLFRHEIPEFLSYLNELTETILNGEEVPPSAIEGEHCSIDRWFEMAEDIQEKMACYQRLLYPNSRVFAGQLFDIRSATLSLYALKQYISLAKFIDPKFKPAVELLFS